MRSFVFFVSMLCLVACGGSNKEGQNIAAVPSWILAVANDSLSADDWALRQRLLQLEQNPDAKNVALFQLVKMMAMKQIAQAQGFPLQPQYLQWESRRIDSATLMPDRIAEIKAICKDSATYQRIFIQESLMPRWLYPQFYKTAQFHQQQAEQAVQRFGQFLVNPQAMDKDSMMGEFWLSQAGLEPIKKAASMPDEKVPGIIDQSKNSQPMNVAAAMQNQQKEQASLMTQQLLAAVQPLKAGQLHPTVLELPQAFWIMQYLGTEGDKKRIKVVAVPKADFSQWLDKEMSQVAIKVIDKEAWNALLAAVPQSKTLFAAAQ